MAVFYPRKHVGCGRGIGSGETAAVRIPKILVLWTTHVHNVGVEDDAVLLEPGGRHIAAARSLSPPHRVDNTTGQSTERERDRPTLQHAPQRWLAGQQSTSAVRAARGPRHATHFVIIV